MVRERRTCLEGRRVVAVGLTGSIGAGKSTALQMFGECGAVVLSADRLVHELYDLPEVVAPLAEHFGEQVVDAEGTIDRTQLASAVHGDAEDLRWLEQLTHPLVAGEIERRIEAAPEGSLVVCEVPLMFETGFERLFDLVVTVEAGADIRRSRSIHKFGLEQFGEFEALQASQEQRTQGSDMVFVNDGALDGLKDFVGTVCERAREMLARGVSEDGR